MSQSAIMEILKKNNKWTTATEIIQILKIKRSSVNKNLLLLKKYGFVKTKRLINNPKYLVYKIK